MRVTITAPNVFNEYGQVQAVGSVFTTSTEYGTFLVRALKALDTDSALLAAPNVPFSWFPVPALVSGAWNSRNGIAALGDSITLRNQPVPSGGNVSYGSDGFLVQGNAMLGWPFEIAAVLGYSGQSSAYILATGLPAVLALAPRPGRCIVLAGTNDAAPGGVSVSAPDATIATLKLIYAGLIAAGIEPEVCTLPPRNDAGMTTAIKRSIWQINRWIREYARANSYVCNDFYRRLVNPTIGGTSGWSLASDGVGAISDTSTDQLHPSDYGAYLMGQEFAANHAWARPPSGSKPSGARDSAMMYVSGQTPNINGGIIPNAAMSGNAGTIGGTATGQLANEWSTQSATVPAGAGTIALSKVPKTDSFGSWQQITILGGNAGDVQGTYAMRSDQDYVSAFGQVAAAGCWKVGDLIFAQCSFEEDATNWGGTAADTNCKLSLRVQFFGASGTTDLWCGLDGTAVSKHRMPSGVLRTPTIAIPAGTTRLYLWVYFRGRGTVRVSDADIYEGITP